MLPEALRPSDREGVPYGLYSPRHGVASLRPSEPSPSQRHTVAWQCNGGISAD